MAKSHEKSWLPCTFLVIHVDLYPSLMPFGNDARVVLEEILVGAEQDCNMGDLAPMFFRRDVRDLFNLALCPRLTKDKGCRGLSL